MGRVNVRDGFWVLLAALWCVDEDNLLPLFLTAALVHEAGHAAALYLASVEVGEKVSCGSKIARVGQTGNATGPHLHLEIWRNGAALDPADYLTEL